jgi:hypothetical protein
MLAAMPVGLLAASVLAILQLQVGASPPRAPDPGSLTLQGTVQFQDGTPLAGAIVFALEVSTRQLLATGQSDRQGMVSLAVEKGRSVLVGVTMRSFEIASFHRLSNDRFRLVVHGPQSDYLSGKAFAAALVADAELETVALAPPSAGLQIPVGVLHGSVHDDTGAPLPGVRVGAFAEESSQPLGTIKTDRQGRYAFVLPVGQYRVVPLAPGMRPSRFRRIRPGQVEITMSVDASPEQIRIQVGADMLSFRLSDSPWPEYFPPAKVQAYLRSRYCLDVNRMMNSVTMQPVNVGPPPVPLRRDGDQETFGPRPIPMPLSVSVRRLKLPKYWWLKKLYTAPPNPAACL